jgi:hypothetical protein
VLAQEDEEAAEALVVNEPERPADEADERDQGEDEAHEVRRA